MTDVTPRTKGTGSLYQRASDGMWCATVTLPDSAAGKRRRKTVVRKREADAVKALRELRAELDRAGDIRTAVPKTGAWLGGWIDSREASGHLRPSTAKTYRAYLTRHIDPAIGRVPLDKLSAAQIERMTAAMVEGGTSPTSALQAHNIIKGALKAAERKGFVTRNVAEFAEAPRKSHVDPLALTLPQALAVLDWADAQDAQTSARWSDALLAGMRQAECLGLTRQYVDLERDVIRVEWQLQRLTRKPAASLKHHHLGGSWYLTAPKSSKGVREVPIVPRLHNALEARLAEIPDDPWALVFTAPEGGPVDNSKDRRAWIAALDAAGVPRVPLHAARHTLGTMLRAAGVDSRVAQVVLGHNSAAMTDHYSHLGDDEATLAMAQLNRLIEAARG